MIGNVVKTIKDNDSVRVSFGVYEQLISLATTHVQEYRGLEALKGVKSSF